MKCRNIAGIALTMAAFSSWAADPQPVMATTTIAGHAVPVVAGGLYDRYHSNRRSKSSLPKRRIST